MPLQRRLPKRGFKVSHALKYNGEITLAQIFQALQIDEIDLQSLKQVGLVGQLVKHVKVINSGELSRKVTLQGRERDGRRQGGDRGGRRLDRGLIRASRRLHS